MDDLVARDGRRAVARERRERLALPRADAARDRDGDRAGHSWLDDSPRPRGAASASGSASAARRRRGTSSMLRASSVGLGEHRPPRPSPQPPPRRRPRRSAHVLGFDVGASASASVSATPRLGLGAHDLGGLGLVGSFGHLGSSAAGASAKTSSERSRLGRSVHRLGAVGARLNRIGVLDALEREREAAAVAVDLDDLHVHRLALRDDLARVLDVVLRELGDVHEPLDAGEDLDEGAEGDDLRDAAFDDVALVVARRAPAATDRSGSA